MRNLKAFERLSKITSQQLYDELFFNGMFPKQLPDVFDLHAFSNRKIRRFIKEPHEPIEIAVKNLEGEILEIQVPNPFLYEQLCRFLSNHWNDIVEYFSEIAQGQNYSVSFSSAGIDSLKKLSQTGPDLTEKPDVALLRIGKRMEISAGISEYFPGIEVSMVKNILAKAIRKSWVEKLSLFEERDELGHSLGLLKGPAAYRLLAEILLAKIDEKLLKKGYVFTRINDDFTCYTRNESQAHEFIRDLSGIAYLYGLELNELNTKLIKLPQPEIPVWKRELRYLLKDFEPGKPLTDDQVRKIFDQSIDIYWKNDMNPEIFRHLYSSLNNYQISTNAIPYLVQISLQLIFLFPSLFRDMEGSVFPHLSEGMKEKFIGRVFKQAVLEKDQDLILLTLYFADRYGIWLKSLDLFELIEMKSGLINFYLYVYLSGRNDSEGIYFLKEEAEKWFQSKSFNQNWLFLYHLLDEEKLPGLWKQLKREGISFIKPDRREHSHEGT